MTSQLYTARQALKLGVVLGAFSTVAAFGRMADANVSEAAARQARMAPLAARLGGEFSDAALARALGVDVATLRAADLPRGGDLAPNPMLTGLGAAQALAASAPEAGFPAQASASVARPFLLTGAPADRQRAVTCLAQALYYEAGSEGEDGERAVAQVVLNRVRNDLFPHSVCGVVFQGAELETGCQFSFTCDGSLGRPAPAADMDRARRIAHEALSGAVFAPVGLATHYHADYVSPYWRTSVARVAKVGAHIFYRWPGELGAPGAFLARYTGVERFVAPHLRKSDLGAAQLTLAATRSADGRVHSEFRLASTTAAPASLIPVQAPAKPPPLPTPPVPAPAPAPIAAPVVVAAAS